MIKSTVTTTDGKQIELDLEFLVFSGGESHVKIRNVEEVQGMIRNVQIYAYVCSAQAMIATAMLSNAIKHLKGYLEGVTIMSLELPYIPGARQDRVCAVGEALSVEVYASIINFMGFHKVFVEDPHSDVAPALIKNVSIIQQYEIVEALLGDFIKKENVVLISPDAGAVKKVMQLAKALGGVEVVKADKIRDTKDGRITGTEIHGDVKGRKVLIVDDLVDGAGTFIPLGHKLKEAGAVEVSLYVTHGIFSKGVDILEGAIDNVYTRHTWNENVEGRNEKGILKDIPKIN